MNAEAIREIERQSRQVSHIVKEETDPSRVDFLVNEFYEFLQYNEMGKMSEIEDNSTNIIGAVVTNWMVWVSLPFSLYRPVLEKVISREMGLITPQEEIAEEQIVEPENIVPLKKGQ